MANIRVQVDGGPRVVGLIRRAMFREARRSAERIGADAAKKANEIVRTKYKQRDYERRRHPGSRRLAGAISYQVKATDDFPIEVSFRVLGGEDVVRRAIVLNFGHRGARIVPSGTWPLRGRYGSSRFVRQGSTGVARILAWPSAGRGGSPPDIFTVGPVTIPRRSGDGFLEEAMKYAVSRNTQ